MSHLEIIRTVHPTRWQRMATALRSITLGPYNTKDRTLAGLFGGQPVSAGVTVNEQTAMNYSAVWAAVNLIAGDIGKVPLILYKVDGESKTRFTSHPLYRLIHDRPNPHMGSMQFRRTLQAHALVWGNGYAEIERDGAGRPVALWPMLPSSVQPKYENGRLVYEVQGRNSRITLDFMDVIHIRALTDDGITGVSTIGNARESIGLGIAAERFGSTFFGNGATFGGIISYPVGVASGASGQQTRDENRKAIEKRHQGVDRAHRLLALYEGAAYKEMGVPPNAAQFLETRQFQIEEVCRWFNLPPHKLKHLARSTYSNIEHQGIEYVVDALDPWWKVWEEELTAKLVPRLEHGLQIIEHVREGLLRGDASARADFYSRMFSIAAITPNEIRKRENLNPVNGGDTVYVPLNTVPLDRLEEWIDAQLKAKEAPKQLPPQPEPPKDDPEAKERAAKLEADIADARRKAQEWEDRHDQRAAELASLAETLRVTTERRDETQGKFDQVNARAYGLTIELEQMRHKAEGLDGALSKEAADLADTILQRDAVIADYARSQEDVIAANAKVDQLVGDVQAVAEDYTNAKRSWDEAQAKVDELVAVKADLERRFDEQVEGRNADAARYTAAIATAAETQLRTEMDRDTALDIAAKAEQERDAALHQMTTELDAAKGREDGLRAERDDAVNAAEAIAKVTTQREGERDALAVEAEALRADLARARADIATELDRQQTQRGVMLSAMRSLFVDASERLLQREVERARRNQQTPDKLRTWMEQFYGTHAEVCRNLFRPLVGPWTAVAGGAPGALLERLVTEHIEASRTALSVVLDADDPDQMAGMLERTLRRWEDERAEVMADALVREGMAG